MGSSVALKGISGHLSKEQEDYRTVNNKQHHKSIITRLIGSLIVKSGGEKCKHEAFALYLHITIGVKNYTVCSFLKLSISVSPDNAFIQCLYSIHKIWQ